jgi:inhibitor of KinA sporulation pathway (predicted exonuclease)
MNPLKDVNYFSLDLELNNKKDGTIPKIIQVGIAIASPLRPGDIKTFGWFLNPHEEITPFITQLTGITNEMVQTQSVTHELLAEEIGVLLKENQVFCSPITWGQNDNLELLQEFKDRNIHFPFFGHRCFDVKTLHTFNQMVNGKSPGGSLSKSMRSYGIQFQGKAHRADLDALNTLRFFFYFLERQRVLSSIFTECKE